MEKVKSKYQNVLLKAFTKQYLERSDEWTHESEMRIVPYLIQKELKVKSDIQVLDIGCGAGHDMEYLARFYKLVVGVDLFSHPRCFQVLKKNKNVIFFKDNFMDLKISQKFGLILDNGCFHHQHPSEYKKYLEKINSLMLKESVLVLSTFNEEDNPISKSNDKFIDDNGRIHRYFNDQELKALLEGQGLKVIKHINIVRKHGDRAYRLYFCRQSKKK
ncbi:class I SAM-dependent methyltransferase [Bacteriovoracales bacterium]|nr:class I SAM-dependent methyltransferase [Bacteriovoracales bacterium]